MRKISFPNVAAPLAIFGLSSCSALLNDPSCRNSHFQSGLAYCQAGQTDQAVVEYRAALACSPDDPCILYNLAVCQVRVSRFSEADLILQQLRQIDPQGANTRYLQALLAFKKNNCDEAVPLLERLSGERADSNDWHYRARCAAKKGDYATAVILYRAAISLNPKERAHRYSLANTLYRMKDFSAAEKEYQAVIIDFDDSLDSRYWRALALEKLGRKREADREFAMFVDSAKHSAGNALKIKNSLARLGHKK